MIPSRDTKKKNIPNGEPELLSDMRSLGKNRIQKLINNDIKTIQQLQKADREDLEKIERFGSGSIDRTIKYLSKADIEEVPSNLKDHF